METTFLQHKPVDYGSPLANALFLALLALHIVPATVAPAASIVALAAKKGSRWHVKSGKVFLWSMIVGALSGIVLDVIRLSFFVTENHTKYPNAGMPSTYPARLAFLYAGFSVLYLAWEGMPPRVFGVVRPAGPLRLFGPPTLLVTAGAIIAGLIVTQFNPWTGALWMIFTFLAAVVVTARLRIARKTSNKAGILQHGFGMSFLAAFSWWGALQGFGPAIAIALKGLDRSIAPYVGDRPGPYSPMIWQFLIGWGIWFVLGAWIWRKTRARRHRLERAPDAQIGRTVDASG
jgi:hypothetical protein